MGLLSPSVSVLNNRLLALLIFLSFFQLNFQKVLYAYLEVPFAERGSNPLFSIWIVAIVYLWFNIFRNWISKRRLTRIELIVALFVILVSMHALVFLFLHGFVPAVISFLAWGAWIPIYLVVGRKSQLGWVYFINAILVFGGVLNAGFVYSELLTGIPIFKLVTIGAVERYYGISQSVSVLGLQLAIGAVASFYFTFQFKGWKRQLFYILIIVQVFALIMAHSRGPLIFLILASLFIGLTIGDKHRVKYNSTIRFLFFLMPIIVIVALILPMYLSTLSVENASLVFLLDALSQTDLGNLTRLHLYAESFEWMMRDAGTLFIGYGAGRLSQMAPYIGTTEFGVESSLFKVFLELGLLGGTLFLWIISSIVLKGFLILRTRVSYEIVPLIAMVGILLMEATIHESLKSWIISFYLWAILASISVVVNRSNLNQPIGHSSNR